MQLSLNPASRETVSYEVELNHDVDFCRGVLTMSYDVDFWGLTMSYDDDVCRAPLQKCKTVGGRSKKAGHLSLTGDDCLGGRGGGQAVG